jgi:uncharacterized membrane protein
MGILVLIRTPSLLVVFATHDIRYEHEHLCHRYCIIVFVQTTLISYD